MPAWRSAGGGFPAQERETLSNRDLSMILNETPGVYATQSGGRTFTVSLSATL